MRSKGVVPAFCSFCISTLLEIQISLVQVKTFDFAVKTFIVKDSLHFAHVKIVAMR